MSYTHEYLDDLFEGVITRRQGSDGRGELIRVHQLPAATKSAVGRRDALRAALRRAEAELAVLERYPERDEFADGTVLKIRQRLINTVSAATGVYTYAAIKADGHWYVTGVSGPNRVTWSQLVEWFADDAVSVAVMCVHHILWDGEAADDTDDTESDAGDIDADADASVSQRRPDADDTTQLLPVYRDDDN